MAHEHHIENTRRSIQRFRLPVANLYCASCADQLERTLTSRPHVVSAKVDFRANSVEVAFHAGMVDEAAIRNLIDSTRRCTCGPAVSRGNRSHAP